MKLRLMTYNILQGGKGRAAPILEVITAHQPDIIILQELANPDLLENFAAQLKMHSFFAKANLQILRDNGKLKLTRRNLGLLSRFPIVTANSYQAYPVRRALLEATIEYAPGQKLALFGVHLLASLALPAELWRRWEMTTILRQLKTKQLEKCLVAGDFNTVSANDTVLVKQFPLYLKFMLNVQFGKIYRLTIPKILAAGFIDCYQAKHPHEPGFTLPTPAPNTRLDYIFVSPALAQALVDCRVVKTPSAVQQASDHYPVIADFEI